jgi:energy-coupling factor transport system substrate-specific component
LLIDGAMVGLTGAVPPMVVNLRGADGKISTAMLVKITVVCAVTGFVMVVAVSASLAFLGIFPFWFAMLYLSLSDIVPMVVGTPLLIRPGLRILSGIRRGSQHWF